MKSWKLKSTVDPSLLAATIDPRAQGGALEQTEAKFITLDVGSHPCIDGYYLEAALNLEGAQSNVYVAQRDGNLYVMKIYRAGFECDQAVVDVLKQNACESLATLVDSGIYQKYYYEVFEYYRGGTLEDFVQRGACRPAFVMNTLVPALDQALHFLHQNKLIHGDLKPSNIFVHENGQKVVLGDFGVAAIRREGQMVPFRGTLEYSPYTAFREDGYVMMDESYDYGALGLVLLYACTGHSYLGGMDSLDRIEALRRLGAMKRMPNAVPPRLRPLLGGLLETDSRSRLGHAACWEFCGHAAEREVVYDRRGGVKARQDRRHSQRFRRSFDFGLVEGRYLTASSLEELLDLCERHWAFVGPALASEKLEEFLRELSGSGDMYQTYVYDCKKGDTNQRTFMLWMGLVLALRGRDYLPVMTGGEEYSSLLDLLDKAESGQDLVATEFLSSDNLLLYLKHFGKGEDVIEKTTKVLQQPGSTQEKATLLKAIYDPSSCAMTLGGEPIVTVDDLLMQMMSADFNEVVDFAGDPTLVTWLYQHQCARALNEMRSFQ